MKIDLSGTTAVVTGSTGGIGHAIARGLAGAGASVVVNGRTQAKVDAAVATIVKAVPTAKVGGVAADVSTAAGSAKLVEVVPTSTFSSTMPASSSRRTSLTSPMRTGRGFSRST